MVSGRSSPLVIDRVAVGGALVGDLILLCRQRFGRLNSNLRKTLGTDAAGLRCGLHDEVFQPHCAVAGPQPRHRSLRDPVRRLPQGRSAPLGGILGVGVGRPLGAWPALRLRSGPLFQRPRPRLGSRLDCGIPSPPPTLAGPAQRPERCPGIGRGRSGGGGALAAGLWTSNFQFPRPPDNPLILLGSWWSRAESNR